MASDVQGPRTGEVILVLWTCLILRPTRGNIKQAQYWPTDGHQHRHTWRSRTECHSLDVSPPSMIRDCAESIEHDQVSP
eukprot:5263576-Amphidinium_carterae.1